MTAMRRPIQRTPAARADVGDGRRSEPTESRHHGAAHRLTVAVAAAAAVSAFSGLLVDGLYASGRHGSGAAATSLMLRAYDLVTLVVVLPALLWASTGARRSTTSGRLVALASLAYLAYTYAYYVFGNGFTDLLLLHITVLTGSIIALICALPRLADGMTLQAPRRPLRGPAATLGLLATALGGMWIYVCLAYATTGTPPEGSLLVETDQMVQLGIVLDLTVLVPLYGISATLLWRGQAWGAVLGAIALVAGIMHQCSYLLALVFQHAAGVPGAVNFDPLEPVIVSLYVIGAVLLFRELRQPSVHVPGSATP